MTISFRKWLPGLTRGSMLLAAPFAMAESTKTYQVTGPVLEVTDSSVTVAKDKEKWQLARDKDTKITGELKVGAKVTIQYRMTAATVEVKGDAKAAGKAEAKADAKADAKPDAKAEAKPEKPAKK
jgi:hypothetical protein